MSRAKKNAPPFPMPPPITKEGASQLESLVERRKMAQRARLAAQLAALDAPVEPKAEPVADLSGLLDEARAIFAGIKPADAQAVARDREMRRIRPVLAEAGIKPEHLPALATFAPHPSQLATLAELRRLIGSGLGSIGVLIGPRGTGKTHLAAQLIRDFAERTVADEDALADYIRRRNESPELGSVFMARNPAPSVRTFTTLYLTAARLFGRQKELFSNVGTINGEQRQSEMDKLGTAYDLVIVDELQESADGHEKRIGLGKILTSLCDARYASRLPTILISNHYDPAAPDSLQLISDFLGDSIVSRANQHGGFLIADWPSFRG